MTTRSVMIKHPDLDEFSVTFLEAKARLRLIKHVLQHPLITHQFHSLDTAMYSAKTWLNGDDALDEKQAQFCMDEDAERKA